MTREDNELQAIAVLTGMVYPNYLETDYQTVVIDLKTLTQKKCLALIKEEQKIVVDFPELLEEIKMVYEYIEKIDAKTYDRLLENVMLQSQLHGQRFDSFY